MQDHLLPGLGELRLPRLRPQVGSLPVDGRMASMPYLQNGNSGARSRMSSKSSKRNFTKKALNTKRANFVSGVMRGGIRF